jgi:hypothetical protein
VGRQGHRVGSSNVASQLRAAHRGTAKPRIVYSQRLHLRGRDGTEPMRVTDADLRAASPNERRIFEKVRREQFVEVHTVQFGHTDGTDTVRFEVPSIRCPR